MKNFRRFLLIFMAIGQVFSLTAQDEKPPVDQKKHRIVIQLTSNDTSVQKNLVRQIGNILEGAPRSRIEVVCHSNGISFLQTAQTKQALKIKDLKRQGVEFSACQNTMRERKIKPEELLPECGTVPSGVLEVVKKQEKGWAYLRAGL